MTHFTCALHRQTYLGKPAQTRSQDKAEKQEGTDRASEILQVTSVMELEFFVCFCFLLTPSGAHGLLLTLGSDTIPDGAWNPRILCGTGN